MICLSASGDDPVGAVSRIPGAQIEHHPDGELIRVPVCEGSAAMVSSCKKEPIDAALNVLDVRTFVETRSLNGGVPAPVR